jgi:hypothetical protein
MYGSIRRYTFKADLDRKTLDDLGRIERTFVPHIQEISGFHSYYLLKVSEKEIVGFGIFDDKKGSDESGRRAVEFVKSDSIRDKINSPEIIEGDLRIARETPVTA